MENEELNHLRVVIMKVANALQHLMDAQNGPPLLITPEDKAFWELSMEKARVALQAADIYFEKYRREISDMFKPNGPLDPMGG